MNELSALPAAFWFYERWKRRADQNPEWAKENPIEIRVKRDASGVFQVEMQPELDE